MASIATALMHSGHSLPICLQHGVMANRGATASLATKHAAFTLLKDLYIRHPGLVPAAGPLPLAPPSFATSIAFRNGPLQTGVAVPQDRYALYTGAV